MSVTLWIIVITGLISFYGFNNQSLFHKLKHHPWSEYKNGEYHRLLTAGFLHGSWLHLLINLFVFYGFGMYVEIRYTQAFGPVKGGLYFVLIYLLTIIVANIPTYLKHREEPGFASIGASGAVSGILFAFILYEPWNLLYLYGIIPIPAIVAGIAFLIYSSWASRKGRDMIDHDAHFYGAIVGFVGSVVLQPHLLSEFLNKLINVQL
jgi:membrane associated rhomboid family serine protease